MIGIRWIFGLAGFFGWGDLGAWSAANLMPQDGMPSLFGNSGILAADWRWRFGALSALSSPARWQKRLMTPNAVCPRA